MMMDISRLFLNKMGNPYRAALKIASKYHEGQVRKYTGEPYINHLTNVAELTFLFCGRETLNTVETAVSVAVLHDILEDTPCTPSELFDALVKEKVEVEAKSIVDGVLTLTSPPPAVNFNRNKRKDIANHNLMRSANASWQIIKLCDIADNAKSIKQYDPKFFKVFREECLKTVNIPWYSNASLAVAYAKEQLGE